MKSTLTPGAIVGDEYTFVADVRRAGGTNDRYALTVAGSVAAAWRVSPAEAAEALAASIDQVGPEPLPSTFRFASETVPPSLPLGAICQTIAMGKWAVFVVSATER